MSIDYEALSQLRGQSPISLDPRRTALLVIDVQRYFVHPDHPFGRTWEQVLPGEDTRGYFERVRSRVLPNLRRLQEAFRAHGTNLFYTAFGSQRADGLDMPGWARQHNALGVETVGSPIYPPADDPSWQIEDSVAPRPEETVVAKSSSGPLNSTRLDQTLHLLGIDALVVAGLCTDVCVVQAAREFADRGFEVVVAEDAATTVMEPAHDAALQTFAMVFGRVRSTAAILRMLTPEA